MKFLLWAVITFVAVSWLLRLKKSASVPGHARQNDTNRGTAEAMLECAHCGVHVPASEVFRNGTGAVFCSEAHRKLHLAD